MEAEIYHICDMSQPYLDASKPIYADNYKFVYRYIMSDDEKVDLNTAIYEGILVGIAENRIPNLCMAILNNIYKRLNIEHPQDYKVRSLSVGDIIIMSGTPFRVEIMGFSIPKLPSNFREACSRKALEGAKL